MSYALLIFDFGYFRCCADVVISFLFMISLQCFFYSSANRILRLFTSIFENCQNHQSLSCITHTVFRQYNTILRVLRLFAPFLFGVPKCHTFTVFCFVFNRWTWVKIYCWCLFLFWFFCLSLQVLRWIHVCATVSTAAKKFCADYKINFYNFVKDDNDSNCIRQRMPQTTDWAIDWLGLVVMVTMLMMDNSILILTRAKINTHTMKSTKKIAYICARIHQDTHS